MIEDVKDRLENIDLYIKDLEYENKVLKEELERYQYIKSQAIEKIAERIVDSLK